jgi:hypothetical protein
VRAYPFIVGRDIVFIKLGIYTLSWWREGPLERRFTGIAA